jgi:hypothetical protein
MSVEIALLYFDGCPNWRVANELLDRLAYEHQDVIVQRRIVDTPEVAERVGFVGSPTILIDGVDPWALDGAAVGLSCRVYTTPDGLRGSPTWDQLEAEVTSRRQGQPPDPREYRSSDARKLA